MTRPTLKYMSWYTTVPTKWRPGGILHNIVQYNLREEMLTNLLCQFVLVTCNKLDMLWDSATFLRPLVFGLFVRKLTCFTLHFLRKKKNKCIVSTGRYWTKNTRFVTTQSPDWHQAFKHKKPASAIQEARMKLAMLRTSLPTICYLTCEPHLYLNMVTSTFVNPNVSFIAILFGPRSITISNQPTYKTYISCPSNLRGT